jgi:hypothetical protein
MKKTKLGTDSTRFLMMLRVDRASCLLQGLAA